MKTKIVFLLVIVIGCVAGGTVVFRYHALHKPAPQTVKAAQEGDAAGKNDQIHPTAAPGNARPAPVATPAAPEERTPPEATAGFSTGDSRPQPVKGGRQVSVNPPPAPRRARTPAPAPADVLVPEPMARQALCFVGADAEAEMIWNWAINDPNLSRSARQNLIEDLNEDGFSDPKRPGVEDLPLIVSRIALIEELAPYAMDEANFDAFAEAYKDLVNMYNRLTGN